MLKTLLTRVALWLTLLVVVVTVLAAPRLTFAQEQNDNTPLPLAEYWGLVDRSRDIVSRNPSPGELADLADQWAAVTTIQLDNGLIVTVDSLYLVNELRRSPANTNGLTTYLATLEAEAGRERVPAFIDPTDRLELLDQILERREFEINESQNALARWLETAQSFLGRLVLEIFPSEFMGLFGDSLVGPLLAGLMTLIVVVILGLVARSLASDFVSEAHLDLNGNGDVDLTAASAYDQAQANSETGDYRTAVRYLYLSTLLSLEEQDLLRYDRSKTNREYLRTIRHEPYLYQTLKDVIDVFDRVWYGYQPIDQATYDSYAAKVKDLRRPSVRVRESVTA